MITLHTYRAEAGEGGDPGGGAPPPDAQTTPDTQTTPDAGVTLDQLHARIAEMQAKLDGADQAAADAAEAARVAALSEAEREREALSAERAKLDEALGGLRRERLTMAADKLGVLPHFRQYLPDVDPADGDGAAALEQWAKTHPEAVRVSSAPDASWQPAPKSKLAKIWSGEATHPLVSRDAIAKLGGFN